MNIFLEKQKKRKKQGVRNKSIYSCYLYNLFVALFVTCAKKFKDLGALILSFLSIENRYFFRNLMT